MRRVKYSHKVLWINGTHNIKSTILVFFVDKFSACTHHSREYKKSYRKGKTQSCPWLRYWQKQRSCVLYEFLNQIIVRLCHKSLCASAVWSCMPVLKRVRFWPLVEFVPGLRGKTRKKKNWWSILETCTNSPIFNQFTS